MAGGALSRAAAGDILPARPTPFVPDPVRAVTAPHDSPPLRPAAIGAGARIALVAPAGPVAPEAIDVALERVRALGWEPVLGEHARGRAGYLAGSDAERAADLNAALRSTEIDAVWCLRGGYGTMRILPEIDWAALKERPRPLIGFSDNTALHLAALRAGIVSFHGPHAAFGELPPFAIELLRRVLCRAEPAGVLPFPAGSAGRAETWVAGIAEGPLVGGNLALLAATLGTPYALPAEGALLFLEEIGEHVYRLDRLLAQLRLAGVFDRVAGVVLGDFADCPDEGREGVPLQAEVLRGYLEPLGVPVASGFPFGHVADNWTLPLGVRARLDADAGTLALLESAVAPA
jgi:muramoyltetrapeptide carboxypeptidase